MGMPWHRAATAPAGGTPAARTLAAGLLAAGLAGCGGALPGTAPTSLPTGTCPRPGSSNAAIDYVDFVMYAGRMYTSGLSGRATPLPDVKIGPVVGTVACRIADTNVSPDFRYRDGDASYLTVGTRLYRVVGYRDTFRIAAKADDGTWRLFEVTSDDSARSGADLLDLSPGVTQVRLVDVGTGEVRASLKDPARVRALVASVLAAPAVPEASSRDAIGDEPPLLVRFELADGTSVDRVWHRTAGYLGYQIEAPPALADAFPAG